ncbi:MAG TPA: hypothetical protein VFZ66_27675 [Herpetosiphonaceae bacterium]
MPWERTTGSRVSYNLGAYRGVVERTDDDQAWTARVEAPNQVYQSVVDYPTLTAAQAWVEQQIEALLRAPPGR